MKRYIIEVNVNPQIHEGNMARYWQICLITEDGKFTVKDGWKQSLYHANKAAYEATVFDLKLT